MEQTDTLHRQKTPKKLAECLTMLRTTDGYHLVIQREHNAHSPAQHNTNRHGDPQSHGTRRALNRRAPRPNSITIEPVSMEEDAHIVRNWQAVALAAGVPAQQLPSAFEDRTYAFIARARQKLEYRTAAAKL